MGQLITFLALIVGVYSWICGCGSVLGKKESTPSPGLSPDLTAMMFDDPNNVPVCDARSKSRLIYI